MPWRKTEALAGFAFHWLSDNPSSPYEPVRVKPVAKTLTYLASMPYAPATAARASSTRTKASCVASDMPPMDSCACTYPPTSSGVSEEEEEVATSLVDAAN